jgi:folate-binding protein YgfZ
LDLLCVIDEGETLGVISLPGRAAQTIKFLRSRIFFSDQVTVEDQSRDLFQVYLFGSQSDILLDRLGLVKPEPDQVHRGEIAGEAVIAIAEVILGEHGYRLVGPVSSLEAIQRALDEVGVRALDSETFQVMRVEAGQPGPSGELVEAYTPLEVGLQGMISNTKGCYTGQEVIARQITYDKVSKSLVGVKLDELAAAGTKIQVDDKAAGTLTSVVQSPRFGWIGLAVVRRQYGNVGTRLAVIGKDGASTQGEVAPLPFQ